MAHFAQIDENDIVTRVLVIKQDEIDTGAWGDPASWIKTSYNTKGGVHYEPNSGVPSADQSKALRKNFAGVGMIYDRARDAFYSSSPYPSWALDEFSCQWQPPVPLPDGALAADYRWDEGSQSWIKREDSAGGVN
jgi:hypothetical protein